MELRSYLGILERRGILVFLVVIVAVGVVMAQKALQQPIYVASAKVRVILDSGMADFRLNQDYNMRLLNTYKGVVESDLILRKIIDLQSAPLTVDDLRSKIDVQVIPDTEFISIAVHDADPNRARELANTLADQLIAYTQGLYAGISKSTVQIVEEQLSSLENELNNDRQQQVALLASPGSASQAAALTEQIRVKTDSYDRLLGLYETARLNESLRANSVTVVTPATAPNSLSNGPKPMDVGLGLVVGLIGGLLLALLLEKLDTRVHTPGQLELLSHLPVLGAVSERSLSVDQLRHATGTGKSERISEEYRLLSINVRALRIERYTNMILITSAVAMQSKSIVAANLARTLAELGYTLFLVEGDLRHPAIDGVFGSNNGFDLSRALADHSIFDGISVESLRPIADQPNLFVIGGGSRVANPATLLASPPMNQLITSVRSQADIALIDSPPVLNMADASVLASKVDGVLIVVRQSSTKRDQVLAAIKQLQASGGQVLGFVFVRKGRHRKA